MEEAEYEPVMLFLNHSCEPNVGFAGNVVLVAVRDISADEELTADYALLDGHDGMMEGGCRAAWCRGAIGGRDWQRPGACGAGAAGVSPPACGAGCPTRARSLDGFPPRWSPPGRCPGVRGGRRHHGCFGGVGAGPVATAESPCRPRRLAWSTAGP